MTRLWQKSTAFRPCKFVLRKLNTSLDEKTLTMKDLNIPFYKPCVLPVDRPVKVTPNKCENSYLVAGFKLTTSQS